jgi:hypothetical protein
MYHPHDRSSTAIMQQIKFEVDMCLPGRARTLIGKGHAQYILMNHSNL